MGCWCSRKNFCNCAWSYFTFNIKKGSIRSSLRFHWPCRCSAQWKQRWEESEEGDSNKDQTWAQLKLSSPSVAVVSYCRHSPSDSRALKPDKHWHLISAKFTFPLNLLINTEVPLVKDIPLFWQPERGKPHPATAGQWWTLWWALAIDSTGVPQDTMFPLRTEILPKVKTRVHHV